VRQATILLAHKSELFLPAWTRRRKARQFSSSARKVNAWKF
jgi:hypothetical protein